MSLFIEPAQARSRYASKVDQVRSQFPASDGNHVVTGTGVKTQPFDSSYTDADLFLGSHVEDTGSGENKLHVLSYKAGVTMDEGFVERTERPHWYSPKTRVLHAYAVEYQSPGGTPLEAAITSIDLKSGQTLRRETGGPAFDDIQPLEDRLT